MIWEPTLATQQTFVVTRVGMLKNEVRIYLRANGEDVPRYVMRLIGVFKFSDALQREQAIQITDYFPHGSFGWDVPHDEPHHSIMLSSGKGGSLLALAREVEYCMAEKTETLNWPG